MWIAFFYIIMLVCARIRLPITPVWLLVSTVISVGAVSVWRFYRSFGRSGALLPVRRCMRTCGNLITAVATARIIIRSTAGQDKVGIVVTIEIWLRLVHPRFVVNHCLWLETKLFANQL